MFYISDDPQHLLENQIKITHTNRFTLSVHMMCPLLGLLLSHVSKGFTLFFTASSDLTDSSHLTGFDLRFPLYRLVGQTFLSLHFFTFHDCATKYHMNVRINFLLTWHSYQFGYVFFERPTSKPFAGALYRSSFHSFAPRHIPTHQWGCSWQFIQERT